MTRRGPELRTAVALTTSSRQGSLCVRFASGDRVDAPFPEGLVHGREAIPNLKRILEEREVGIDTLDLVAVDLGPGSYTGIRVGVATARTLAFACGSSLIGFASLDILARGAPPGPRTICPLIDARRGQIYRGVYERDRDGFARRVSPLVAVILADAGRELPPGSLLLGDGAPAVLETLPGTGDHEMAPEEFWRPRAAVLMDLALARHASGKDLVPQDEIVPIYLRRSEAEIKADSRSKS